MYIVYYVFNSNLWTKMYGIIMEKVRTYTDLFINE